MKEKNEATFDTIPGKVRQALYYNTNIQIINNSKAIIENCKHIVECNDIMVKLLSADFQVIVWGYNLTISDYNTENIIVNGKISSVELIPRRKTDKNDF